MNKVDKEIDKIYLVDKKDYSLDIAGITLRTYSSGVGILSFHLENNKYTNENDVLKINDFGRRIYPQYLPLGDVKKSFLAYELEIQFNENSPKPERFEYFSNDEKVENNPIKLSNTIMELLGDEFTDDKNETQEKILVTPIIDDRMFVVSWYGNNDKIKYLGGDITRYYNRNYVNYLNKNGEYSYLEDPFWYKYIFVDADSVTCQSNLMMKNLLKNQTYDRWINYGTLYGVSRYSFVILSSNLNTLRINGAEYIFNHIKTMYYQMAVLALMQRASILRFSSEASYISNLLDETGSKAVERIRELHSPMC
ncbi:hypothetical protein [Halonatronum saccharophilum]|uniref:hypothetical protein n=1 Tax=Halonatronum saccharophilum TaxID=150060 RepID=UPI000481173E|nr:hypothetical protein [Halonatronum saccharophilum]